MTLAVREQILVAVKARLATIAGVTVERNRNRPVQAFPALVLRDGGTAPGESVTGRQGWGLQLDVEGWVSAADGDAAGAALSELQARVVEAFAADQTLGGLAVDVTEGETQVDLDDGAGRAVTMGFSTLFTVQFWTRPFDPRTAAP